MLQRHLFHKNRLFPLWMSLNLALSPLYGEIIADKTAPANQQPFITSTANGTTQVNIQAPSATGVSRNTYSRFDVEKGGVILNNSYTNTATTLGGWIQGNQALANGTAKIILNEVNSNDPTYLRGMIEVGGDRAQVVVANPSGVSCDGCGFINASRATITTGTPILQNGNLEGFLVQRGGVSFEGAGYNGLQTDFTDIIARWVTINAGLWANDLKITTGANQVNTTNTIITPLVPQDNKPLVGIDTGLLGGMYAGKITLIANENGVGVKNSGTLVAQNDLIITANGQLENKGTLSSLNTTVTTNDTLTNSGVMYGEKNLAITTSGKLDNSAIISSNENMLINAYDIIGRSNSVYASGMKRDGSLSLEGNVHLHATNNLDLSGVINAGDAIIEGKNGTFSNLSFATATAQLTLLSFQNINHSNIYGENLTITTNKFINGDEIGDANTIFASKNFSLLTSTLTNNGIISSNGTLNINSANTLINNGLIASLGSMELSIQAFENTATLQSGSTLDIKSNSLLNESLIYGYDKVTLDTIGEITNLGTIASLKDTSIKANSLYSSGDSVIAAGVNEKGELQTQGSLNAETYGDISLYGKNLAAETLSLKGSTLDFSRSLTFAKNIDLQGSNLSNVAGSIKASENLTITTSGTLTNTNGLLSAKNTLLINDPLQVKTLSVINTTGTIIAGAQTTINADNLTGDGDIYSLGNASIDIAKDFTLTGHLEATSDINFATQGIFTNRSSVIAGNILSLRAGTITNDASGELRAESLILKATDPHTFTNRGLIDGVNTTIEAIILNNLGTGRIYGDSVAIATTTITNQAENASSPIIASRGRMDIGATTLTNKDGATIISIGDMFIGGTLDSNKQTTGAATTITNSSATIESMGDMSISAHTLVNKKTLFETQITPVSTTSFTSDYLPNVYEIWQSYWPGVNGKYSVTKVWKVGTLKTSETSITNDSEKGRILSANTMLLSIEENLNNEYSEILAGKELISNATHIINSSSTKETITESSGTMYGRVYKRSDGSCNRSFPDSFVQDCIVSVSFYDQLTNVSILPTATAIIAANQTLSSSSTTIDNRNTGGDLSQKIAEISPISSTTPITKAFSPIDAPVSIDTPTPTPLVIPHSSLLKTHTEPTAKYLVETDPKFASYKTWLSSDYMISSLSYDPVAIQKRLGDGFYEQKLIREQIGDLTGKRFLGGFTNDEMQYQALMTNAISKASTLGLTIGKPLTPSQIAALDKDIVWMEEKTVLLPDGTTQTVLSPQLYLGANTIKLTQGGAIIQADSITIAATEMITNSGSINANTSLSLASGDIFNQGELSSNLTTSLFSSGDITNLSGKIKGDNISIMANGNFLNATYITSFGGKIAQGTQGLITSSSATSIQTGGDVTLLGSSISTGGALTVNAVGSFLSSALQKNLSYGIISQQTNLTSSLSSGENMTITSGTGTSLSATALSAKEDVALISKGDITLASVKDVLKSDYESSNYKLHTTDETLKTTSITAKGNVVIAATNTDPNKGNISLSSATVESSKGNVALISSGNTSITADQELHSKFESITTKKSGLFSSKTTTTTTNTVTNTSVASSLSGENVTISTGKNIDVTASNVVATNSVDLAAGENLSLGANIDLSSFSQQSTSKGFLSGKASNDTVYKEKVVASTLQGENVTLSAQNDITLEASSLKANSNLIASAKRDINVVAKEYAQGELHQSSKSILGGLSSSSSLIQKDALNLNSALLKTEAASIVLKSGNDLTIIASEVDAGANAQLEAFNKVLIAAGQSSSRTVEKTEKSSLNIGNTLISIATLGLVHTGSAYVSQRDTLQGGNTQAIASTIKAGNDISSHGGSTYIIGSTLQATNDITLVSDTGKTQIDTAVSSNDLSTTHEKIEVKLGNIVEAIKGNIEQVTSGETKIKTKIAEASLDKSATTAKSTTNLSSLLSSKEGSVVMKSLDDITITGSTLQAAKDISLSSEAGNITVQEATDTKNTTTKQTAAKASLNITAQNEYVEVAKATQAALESAKQLTKTKDDYSTYKQELKSLNAKLEDLKTSYKTKSIGIDYSDIEDLQNIIDNVASQEKYYVAAIAAATADLASKTAAVATQTAAAAKSSETYGFSVGVSADVQGVTQKTNTGQSTAVASNLTGNTITLATNQSQPSNIALSGSNLIAHETLSLSTYDLSIKGSTNTISTSSNSQSINGSASMTVYGGGGGILSASYGKNDASSTQSLNTNTLLLANSINLDISNDAIMKGVTLQGEKEVSIQVGNNLSLESLRDESSSNSHGYTIGASMGTSGSKVSNIGGNIGTNFANSYDTNTIVSSITGENVALSVGGNTHLKGSTIASGTSTNGEFVDNGKLSFSTNTLTFSNLSNTSFASGASLGVGGNMVMGGATPSNNNPDSKISSASYSASSSLSYGVTKTLATIGAGTITIKDKENSDDLTRLNTNTTNITKDLYSSQTGTKVSATLDTRLFTTDGQKQIADDAKKASTILDAINQIISTNRAGITDFFAETEKNIKVLDGLKATIANNPQLAEQLSNPNLTPEQKQSMLNEVANTIALSLGYKPNETKLVYTDENGANNEAIKGHYSTQTNTSYINDKNNNSTTELVSTTGHETQHAMDNQANMIITNKADNEVYATNFGNTVANYTDYALSYTGNQTMATTNNHNGAMSITTPNQTLNIITSSLLGANNGEFGMVNKGAGEDLTAKDGAKISWHVYKDNPNATLPPHIKEVTDEASLNKYGLSKKDLVNEKTGFKSSVYINKITGEVTYAFAGTDPKWNDIKTDLSQGAGLIPDAYKQAIDNAVKFNEATQKLGVKASLTGHSLGGGQAAAGSEKTGLEAKTYNAAGVHPITVVNGKGTSSIDNYFMKHDPLSLIQNSQILLPDASGRQHLLEPIKGKSTLKNISEGHSIETIDKYFNSKDKK